MSTDGQRTKWLRNIAANFSRLSRVHERYRRQADRRQHIANSKRECEFTFPKNERVSVTVTSEMTKVSSNM